MIIDDSARTLLHILRGTQYLVWSYREGEDGPKMEELKRALAGAIAELEPEVANLPAPPIPCAVFRLMALQRRAPKVQLS